MKNLIGFPDIFISPVSGKMVGTSLPNLPEKDIFIGNSFQEAVPSPIIKDIKIDLSAIRGELSKIETSTAPLKATYILQVPSETLPKAQALNQLETGLLKQKDGVVARALPGEDYLVPSLETSKIWIGDQDGKPQATLQITESNLPSLQKDHVWQGDSENKAKPVVLQIAPVEATYILQKEDEHLSHAQALNLLKPGILKQADGVISIAIAGEDYATSEELEQIKAETEKFKNEAQSAAQEASTSAEEAATSATEASTSAGEASASAGEATAAAGEATAAAGEASLSAGAASGSAAAAVVSAGAAALSATSASSSSSSASSSADSASSSADHAKDYLDQLLATGINDLPCTGDVNFQGFKLVGVGSPQNPTDGANKAYVDQEIGGVYIRGTDHQITVQKEGKIYTLSFSQNPAFSGKEYMRIPAGKTVDRPLSPAEGMVRYNSEL